MSVVDIELPIKEHKIEWMCLPCHKALQTSMNIGLQKKGVCDRCDSVGYTVFRIADGNVQ
jgi:hypothetical protein